MAKDIRIIPSSGLIAFSGSNEQTTLTVDDNGKIALQGSGSTIFDIQGSQGQLFSVVDNLAGSLMSVNDISGLPILEVFDTDKVVMGEYGTNALVVSGSKVGIGTATPATKLEVAGDINLSTISEGYKIGNINLLNVSTTYTRLYNPEGAIGLYIGDSGDRSNYYDNTYHYFRTANGSSTLGVWNANGLGVGTTSPQALFNVEGTQTIGWGNLGNSLILAGTTTSGIGFDDNEIAKKGTGPLYFGTIDAGSDIIFRAGSANTRMVVDGDTGYVGIGNITPAYGPLHIAGTQNTYIHISNDTTGHTAGSGTSILVENSTGDLVVNQREPSKIRLYTSGAQRAVIDSAGNVGINVTDPAAKLEVLSSHQVRSSVNATHKLRLEARSDYYNDTASAGIWISDGGGTGPFSGLGAHLVIEGRKNSARHIYFKVGDTTSPQHIMAANGRVGIGTTSPTEELHVVGEAIFQGPTYSMSFLGGSDLRGSNQLLVRADGSYLRLASVSNNIYYQAGASHIFQDASQNDIVTINQDGRLDVASDLRLRGNSSNNNLGVVRMYVDSQDQLTINPANDGVNQFVFKPNGDLTVPGAITAQEFHTEFVSASILYSSGSTKFGDTVDDIHSFTGSLGVSGSAIISSPAADSTLLTLASPSSGVNVNFGFEIGDTGISGLNAKNLVIRGSSASSDIAFSPSTSYPGMMVLDGSTGYVGIGTTSPSQILHLFKQAHSNDVQLLVENDGYLAGTKSSLVLKSKGTNGGSVTSGISNVQEGVIAGTLAFYTNGANERMRITSAGNVGIGTTSPAHDLHVDGDRLVFTQTGQTYTDGSTGLTGIGIRNTGTSAAYNAFGIQTGVGSIFQVRNDGHVRIGRGGTDDRDAYLIIDGGSGGSGEAFLSLQRNSTQQFLLNTTNTETQVRNTGNLPIHFYTNDGLRMTVAANGNIGMGTTSPSHKLDIYSNENVPLRVHRPSNANLDSSGAWGIGFSTRGDAITSTTDTRAGIFSYYNGNLFLAAANTSIVSDPDAYARLTILNTGNVGIGTMSPAEKLDVAGTARMDTGITEGIHYVGTGLQHWGDGGTGMNFPSNDVVNLLTAGTTRLGISSGGTVTINSNGEEGWVGNKLNVGSTSDGSNGINILTSATGNAYIIFSDASDNTATEYANQIRYSHTDNFLSIQTVGSERMRIASNGNVGIGTTGPVNKLDVIGTTSVTALRIGSSASGEGIIRHYANGGQGIGIVTGTLDSSGIGLYVSHGSNNRNIGIGTTSPTEKLDVVGGIVADEFLGRAKTTADDTGSGYASYDVVTSVTGPGLYEVVIKGNPNSNGSSAYADYLYGKIIIGTGWNGSNVTHYINYIQENPDPRSLYGSGGGNLTAEALFVVNGVESTSILLNTTYTIRVKISGYSVAGAGTIVRTKKLD